MKKPKTTNRYCPSCKKKSDMKIKLLSTGSKRGALKKGSKERAKLRGNSVGLGNLGRWSKPPITKWKRKTKSTKKAVFVYTCNVCRKAHQSKSGIRTGKVLVE